MMNFEEFKEKLAGDVKEAMEEKGGQKVTVEPRTVEKMNETYEGLTVKPDEGEIGVNLNLDSLYQEYNSGTSYDAIVNKAAAIATEALENRPDFDLDSIKDYDKMKSTLAIEIVSAERNRSTLETVPHKEIEDMAVVYRFIISEGVLSGTGSILVTNQMLDNYGITAEQLHEDAIRNAPEIRPLVIEGMAEVLAKQMGVEDLEMLGLNIPPEQEQMFVASVEGNVHGAGVIAYQNFMDEAAQRAGGELIGLTWDNFDIGNRVLYVDKTLEFRHERGYWRAGPPKTMAGFRMIPLTDEAFDILYGLYQKRLTRKESMTLSQVLAFTDPRTGLEREVPMRNLIFINFRTGEPIKNSTYDTNLYKICEKAGIKPFCMHALRHTFATRCIERGVNPKSLQKILGHAQLSTTMDTYVHVTDDSLDLAMRIFESANLETENDKNLVGKQKNNQNLSLLV